MNTAEEILTRFADDYTQHGPGSERRLIVTTKHGIRYDGYIIRDGYCFRVVHHKGSRQKPVINFIAEIDYSNAKHRGRSPLYTRAYQ